MPVRDIDHVVVMTRDLESARAGWEQLGFTTTPRAVHPFGTANSLIQLQGNFIELLEIDDPERVPEMAGRAFRRAACTGSLPTTETRNMALSSLLDRSRSVCRNVGSVCGSSCKS